MRRIIVETVRFWQLIDEARKENGGWDGMHEILQTKLAALSIEEIISWGEIFDEYHQLSYKNKLWAAAYVINGGCSDDGFDYFRGWLIAQGLKIYLLALRDPDALAKVESCEMDAEYESMLSVCSRAFFRKVGSEDWEALDAEKKKYALTPEMFKSIENEIEFSPDIDDSWEEDDLEDLLPKLCEVFDW
jgi:hypothetical protein